MPTLFVSPVYELVTPTLSKLTPLLKANANQFDTTVDPKCPSCGEEPQTVEH